MTLPMSLLQPISLRKSMMSFPSDLNILQHIVTTSRNLTQLLRSRSSATPSSPLPEPIPDVPPTDIFPPPRSPASTLIAMGLDSVTAGRISKAYMQAAMRLKSSCQKHYGDACRLVLQDRSRGSKSHALLKEAHLTKYTRTLQLWLAEIANKAVSHIDQLKREGGEKLAPLNHKLARLPFNQGAIPLLEAFFEFNAFPSRSDKQQLAAETSMDYRQINIWFQNRRSRTKKDGKKLKKGNTFVGLPPDLGNAMAEILSEDVPCDHAHDYEAEALFNVGSDKQAPLGKIGSLLDKDRPPHAFPTIYPPLCSYAPFPVEGSSHRFAFSWIRKPSSSRSHIKPFSVTQLADLFTNLSVEDDTQRESRRTKFLSKGKLTSTGSTTFTVPLPTLLPTTVTTPILQSTSRSRQRSSPFFHTQEPSSANGQSKETFSTRKRSGLPKRLPASVSTTHGVSSLSQSVCLSRQRSSSASTTSSFSVPTVSINNKRSVAATIPPRIIAVSPPSSSTERRIASLPQRTKKLDSVALPQPLPTIQFSHTPYSRTVSRSSSLSSLSSDSSSSTSEIDTPVSTPPPFRAHLPLPKIPESGFLSAELPDRGRLHDIPFTDNFSPIEGLQLDLLSSVFDAQPALGDGYTCIIPTPLMQLN
ncbi:hypothetical protein BKA93DRAFT_188497 [Sparassis latifolia]